MKKLYVQSSDKFDQNSFLHVFKADGSVTIGEKYTFVEWSNKKLIKHALCVGVEVLRLKQFTESISFLDKNCDLDIYKEIQKSRGINEEQIMVVATFTHISNSKKYYDYARLHY